MARWQSGDAAACKAVNSGSIPLRASKCKMNNSSNKQIEKDLVLIGGGHSHLNVLKSFTMDKIDGLRVTLISDVYETPYSGMLPGFIENDYSLDDIQIDLYKICYHGNFRFINCKVNKIDGNQNLIYFKNRPPLSFDYLSINIGINNDTKTIKNADKYALKLKPISKINYNEIIKNLEGKKVGIIGSGPAGVEISLALKKRYSKIDIFLFTGKNGLLKNYSNSSKNSILKNLTEANINVIFKDEVSEVSKNKIVTKSSKVYLIDKAILSTNGVPPKWLKETNMELSPDGFIQTNNKLQTNFNHIFASGDIINFSYKSLTKSGVYAVKSGSVLTKNIRNFILNKPLVNYNPQKYYLSIIGLSNGKALAYKYNLHFTSKLILKLKKYIDLKFINKFKLYDKIDYKNNIMDCKGCASKVNLTTLKSSLPKNITKLSEDASQITKGSSYVNSIDMITSIVTDPFLLGKISANHALSDIYASFAKPLSALMILQLPKSSQSIHSNDLKQIQEGAKLVLNENSCILSGGHTMIGQDESPVIGFSIVGKTFKRLNRKINNHDVVILTEKLGTGIIFAGVNSNAISSKYIKDVSCQLENGNIKLGKILNQINPLEATDITGYGLGNHLINLINRNKDIKGITILKDKIKLFEGVNECLQKNVNSSFYEQNFNYGKNKVFFNKNDLINKIFFDPQTVGGIAFIIPQKSYLKIKNILEKNEIVFSKIGFIDNSHSHLRVI